MTSVDEKRFLQSVQRAVEYERNNQKVGTLSEKLVHRTLKYYFEPDDNKHEISVSGAIVDVFNDCGICEIQTKNFDRLSSKLAKLLPEYHINIIYPVIVDKTVHWLDPESGEVLFTRKSSKRGRVTDVISELYHIKEFLMEDELKFTVVLLTADDYRILDGYGKDKKKGATKVNIMPSKLVDVIFFSNLTDVKEYINKVLPDNFTAKQLNSILHLRPRQLSLALKFLINSGIVQQNGNVGKAYLYEKIK